MLPPDSPRPSKIWELQVHTHRGRYPMICSPSDRYPIGLGEKLVRGIPKDPAEFEI
jgi:hypothetical protein